jgi:hypothetical protein
MSSGLPPTETLPAPLIVKPFPPEPLPVVVIVAIPPLTEAVTLVAKSKILSKSVLDKVTEAITSSTVSEELFNKLFKVY